MLSEVTELNGSVNVLDLEYAVGRSIEDLLEKALSLHHVDLRDLQLYLALSKHGLILSKPLSQGYALISSLGYYYLLVLKSEIKLSLEKLFSPPGTIVFEGDELFFNPLIRVYHEYILSIWKPVTKAKIALFTPCSNIKPIPESFMNKKIDGLLRKYLLTQVVDRYIVSEPLGIIDYSQAYLFPAAHYDYPPEKLTVREKRVYIEIIAEFLEKISRTYDYVVYSLPRRHRQVFEEALDVANVVAVYVPYNIYYLPRLRNELLRLSALVMGQGINSHVLVDSGYVVKAY